MIRFIRPFMFFVVFSVSCFVHTCSYALEIDTVVIPEEDLSGSVIESALNDVGFATKISDEGNVLAYVRGERLRVHYGSDSSCITFVGHKDFTDTADKKQKFSLINTINDRYVIVRASLTENEDRMWLDFTIPVEEGITRDQIANVTVRFAQIMNSIHDVDSDDILK